MYETTFSRWIVVILVPPAVNEICNFCGSRIIASWIGIDFAFPQCVSIGFLEEEKDDDTRFALFDLDLDADDDFDGFLGVLNATL
jgi:hypothetical protein